jgi:hypothetical protein
LSVNLDQICEIFFVFFLDHFLIDFHVAIRSFWKVLGIRFKSLRWLICSTESLKQTSISRQILQSAVRAKVIPQVNLVSN